MFSRNVPMVPTKEQYGPGSEAENKPTPLPERMKEPMKKTASEIAYKVLVKCARSSEDSWRSAGGTTGMLLGGLSGSLLGGSALQHLVTRNKPPRAVSPTTGLPALLIGSLAGAGLGSALGGGILSGIGGNFGKYLDLEKANNEKELSNQSTE